MTVRASGSRSTSRRSSAGGFDEAGVLKRAGVSPAVHQQVLAGEVSSMGAAEKRASRTELFRPAETAGDLAGPPAFELLLYSEASPPGLGPRGVGEPVRLEGAGQEIVDRDIVPGNLAGET